MLKHLENPPYTVNPSVVKRFDARKNIFGRVISDKTAPFFMKSNFFKAQQIIQENKPGYSRIDLARALAAWTVYNHFSLAFTAQKLRNQITDFSEPRLEKYEITDVAQITKDVKGTALNFGAFKVGICKINNLWVYTNDMFGQPVDIEGKYKFAIVMAVQMNLDEINKSPWWCAVSEGGLAYSKMAMIASSIAEFIRNLGYNAYSSGNDTALSIPLAIDAGLGELGRNGLLITPEIGSCLRICKVFTDLPLNVDKPIEFGVAQTCKNCSKCADACEANCISREPEPSYEVKTVSNNQGILRWAVNHDACYDFWLKNGGGCSSCISACPYTHNKIKI